jgi:hypothetical protein
MTILDKESLEILVYEDITARQVHRWGEDTSLHWKAERYCEEEKEETIDLHSKSFYIIF